MAKVANDAVARPTNAQPRGVGLGREEGLLPRLGGDDRHRQSALSSFQCGQCGTESLASVVYKLFSHHSSVWSDKSVVLLPSSFQ